MRLGEVCLHTENVIKLADFYKALLDIDNGSDDPVHQMLIGEETQLSIYNDGQRRSDAPGRISLAFTVEDVNAVYQKLLTMGVCIVEPPQRRPWGTVNMSLLDPDGNLIYLRQFSAS